MKQHTIKTIVNGKPITVTGFGKTIIAAKKDAINKIISIGMENNQ